MKVRRSKGSIQWLLPVVINFYAIFIRLYNKHFIEREINKEREGERKKKRKKEGKKERKEGYSSIGVCVSYRCLCVKGRSHLYSVHNFLNSIGLKMSQFFLARVGPFLIFLQKKCKHKVLSAIDV